MKCFKTLNRKIKRWDIWDIGLIKWSSIFFGAIVGAYISNFVKEKIVWMIVITVLLVLRPLIKFYKKA